MASKYTVRYHGIDGRMTKAFSKLEDVQAYVKARWQGVDYIDGEDCFHTDYAQYTLTNCVLNDLGQRGTGEDGYWEWYWKDLANPSAAANFDRRLSFEDLCKAGSYVVLRHMIRHHWNTDAYLGETISLVSVHHTLGGAESAVPADGHDDMYYSVRGPEYYAPLPARPYVADDQSDIPF